MAMPTFEVQGPCPDGDFFVVRVQLLGQVTNRLCLCEMYPTADEAQVAADRFTADPDNAPTQ